MKIKIDSTFNSLVNDQGLTEIAHSYNQCFIFLGLPNTNVEGDLKVEHQNLAFKQGLLKLAGMFLNHK